MITQGGKLEAQFAMVCLPKVASMWRDTDTLMKQIIDPALRSLAVFLLVIIVVMFHIKQNSRFSEIVSKNNILPHSLAIDSHFLMKHCYFQVRELGQFQIDAKRRFCHLLKLIHVRNFYR